MKYLKRGLYFLMALLFPIVVSAQFTDSILNTYQEFYGWIDFFIYLLIFSGVAREFVEIKAKKEGADVGPGGQILYIGLGLLFAVALTTWEVSAGYSLVDLGPIVLILLVIIFFARIFGYVKEGKGTFSRASLRSLAILLIIIISIIYLFFPGILLYYFWASWIKSFLLVLFLVSLVYLILSVIFSATKEIGKEPSGYDTFEGKHREPRTTLSGVGDAAKWLTSPVWWPLKKLAQGAKYGLKELGVPGLKGLGKSGYEATKYLGKKPFEAGAYVGKGIGKETGKQLEERRERKREMLAMHIEELRNSTLSILCSSKKKNKFIDEYSTIDMGDTLKFIAYLQSKHIDINKLKREWTLDNKKIRKRFRPLSIGNKPSVLLNISQLNEGGHIITLVAKDKKTGVELKSKFQFEVVPGAFGKKLLKKGKGIEKSIKAVGKLGKAQWKKFGKVYKIYKLKNEIIELNKIIEDIEKTRFKNDRNKQIKRLNNLYNIEKSIEYEIKKFEFQLNKMQIDDETKALINRELNKLKTKSGNWIDYKNRIDEAKGLLLQNKVNECLKKLKSLKSYVNNREIIIINLKKFF